MYPLGQLQELQLELVSYGQLVLLCFVEDGLHTLRDCHREVTQDIFLILLSRCMPCASRASTMA